MINFRRSVLIPSLIKYLVFFLIPLICNIYFYPLCNLPHCYRVLSPFYQVTRPLFLPVSILLTGNYLGDFSFLYRPLSSLPVEGLRLGAGYHYLYRSLSCLSRPGEQKDTHTDILLLFRHLLEFIVDVIHFFINYSFMILILPLFFFFFLSIYFSYCIRFWFRFILLFRFIFIF